MSEVEWNLKMRRIYRLLDLLLSFDAMQLYLRVVVVVLLESPPILPPFSDTFVAFQILIVVW